MFERIRYHFTKLGFARNSVIIKFLVPTIRGSQNIFSIASCRVNGLKSVASKIGSTIFTKRLERSKSWFRLAFISLMDASSEKKMKAQRARLNKTIRLNIFERIPFKNISISHR
jgi:hypothetical protein